MRELFVEVRCEELPARLIEDARSALAAGLVELLKGIPHGAVRTWATPRRIAVAIADVAAGRPVETQLVTGPPAQSAFRDGQPTRVAEGFARGRGVPVESLEIVEGPRGPVIAARIQAGGERTVAQVAAGLEAAILGMGFPRSMRWGSGSARWARPIHAVAALYGGERIPATVLGAETVCETFGHRLTPGPFSFTDSASWLAGLEAHHVRPDPAARRQDIEQQLRDAAAALGGAVRDWELLDEVVHLVEWPVVVQASFGAALLDLPPRLLVESMKVHQRVFPVYIEGALDHHFLVVSNQPFARDPEATRTIADGNTRVLTSRFYDARFFYAEDRRRGLESFGERLAGMQWIRKGGSMAEKAVRVAARAEALAPLFGAEAAVVSRAGALCKNDLASQMVGEFPELQGHVGRLLAALAGEPEAVAQAIEEHYLPLGQGGALPGSPAGRALALADRLDTLLGCFQLGLKPKGSADPLGLRRAAIGALQIVLGAGVRVSLPDLLGEDDPDLVAFVETRLRGLLQDEFATELVHAVMETGDRDAVALRARLSALADLAATAEFGPLKTTFKRVMGLTRDHRSADYDATALQEPAEQALHAALLAVRDEARALGARLAYDQALAQLSRLKPVVDRLFDEVLVMHPEEGVRHTRLSLLRAIANEFHQIADFTQLSAEG